MHLAPSTAWAWLIACAVVILLFPLAAQFGNLKGKLSSFRTWVWAIALLGIVAAGFMPFAFDTDIAYFEVQPFIFFITGTPTGCSLSWGVPPHERPEKAGTPPAGACRAPYPIQQGS